MIIASVIFLVGLAAVFADSSAILKSTPMRAGGLILGITALLAGLVLMVAYVVLNQRLSGAELRSREEP